MPKIPGKELQPFWQTADGRAIKLYHGHVLDVLRRMPAQSVHMVVTSPPYWGLRDYGTDKTLEIGSEKTPDEFVANMVAVFREVRRVLRDDGTLWLNLGDSYSGGGGFSPNSPSNQNGSIQSNSGGSIAGKIRCMPSGNLVGIPWRVALALQADGWILRQDIIWCLSGGTWLYVRGAKGEMPIQLHDLSRYDNLTDMELWNGQKWTKILGISKSPRVGDEIELVLRSGERISCTPSHKFPLKDGRTVEAGQLKIGDKLVRCRLPEPDEPRRPEHISTDAAWFAGLYMAEGCGVDTGKMHIAGHRKELARWNKVLNIVKTYGGSCKLKLDGNQSTIHVHGKVLCAIVKEFVSGKDAKTKGIGPALWKYGNEYLEAFMDGYLSGDGGELWAAPGGKQAGNWSLGFTRNYNLERDLRVVCARLGWTLIVRPGTSKCGDKEFATFHGEIRKVRSGHGNEKDREEIVEIRKSRCREVYDVGVADAPNLFSLASGILTHNSKPSPMPESVKNRCTKSHEYVFLLTKKMGYFYDAEAIKEVAEYGYRGTKGEFRGTAYINQAARGQSNDEKFAGSNSVGGPNDDPSAGRNKRSVWNVSSQGYPGAHFATYPPKLIEPCILAGTSEYGCCVECGAPWKRVVEEKQLTRERPNDYVKRTGEEGTGNSCANSVAGVESKTVGWEPTCDCFLDKDQNCRECGTSWKSVEAKANIGDWGGGNRGLDVKEVGMNRNVLGGAKEYAEYQAREASKKTVKREHPCECFAHKVQPCVVLDPFIGSGTTCCVSIAHGRHSIGIDLSEKYLRENAIPRIEGELLSRPALKHLTGRQAKRLEIGRKLA